MPASYPERQLLFIAGRICRCDRIPPAQTLPEEYHDGAIGLKHLLVDTGLSAAKVASLVRVGDLVSFNTPAVDYLMRY